MWECWSVGVLESEDSRRLRFCNSCTPELLKSIMLGPRSREQVGSKPLERES